MSVTNSILYIKGEQNVELTKQDITLGDLVTMECGQQNVVSKLKSTRILKAPDKNQHRYVISVLRIIECIHKEYPGLEVQNIGATDIIVTCMGDKTKNRVWEVCQIISVVLICFFGAAFAIMAFNNDSDTPKIFERVCKLFTGSKQEGREILELSYSVGLSSGILVFFNHFGKKKFTVDPTPIEVEMRLYENDIQTTLISEQGRRGKELDVGNTSCNGSNRS